MHRAGWRVACRGVVASVVVALALLALPGAAPAACTGSSFGPIASLSCDGAADVLTIDSDGTRLRHNRFGIDPGFNSAIDFDTIESGD